MQYIVCEGGGVLDEQWFTPEEWETRVKAHERMRAAGSMRSRGAGDYTVTEKIRNHPKDPQAAGKVASYKWK